MSGEERYVYVRNAEGLWWIGSGVWVLDFGPRVLRFSSIYYASLDVGAFASDGMEYVEQESETGRWREARPDHELLRPGARDHKERT